MADELWSTLLRFHREVIAPDLMATLLRFHEEVSKPEIMGTLRQEMAANHRETLTHFDAVYRRLDRLVIGYESLTLSLNQLADRLPN